MVTKMLLYKEHASALPEAVRHAETNGINMIITPVANPLFFRDFNGQRHLAFTRPDLIMEPATWVTKVVCKISDYINCDSDNENVRKHSEATVRQEMAFAQHVGPAGHMLVRLKGSNSMNLARILVRDVTGKFIIEVPMIDPKTISKSYRQNKVNDDADCGEDTWKWWNNFRAYTDYNPKFRLALELSSDIPTEQEISRWLGEPLDTLIIRSDTFILNKKNYPVLSRAHQSVVLDFLNMGANLCLKANTDDETNLTNYVEYLNHIISRNQPDPMAGYDDILQIPLQPLYDNLDAYTYEIFEKDPIKYHYYQKAIELALIDKVDEADIESKTIVVMVVGAGRGPLIRSTINASINTKRKIKIFVIEKNPNALVTLIGLKRELWPDKDITIISTDMRDFDSAIKGDILVSELLGSLGDNELSPECLDGAQKHLKPDGISIPSKSTSYINPIMTQKILSSIREQYPRLYRAKGNPIETQFEMMYVVYLKNVYHIALPKPLFTFEHPNHDALADNTRFTKLSFDIPQDCMVTGFAGYFDTVLYKDVVLSIHPQMHSKGLVSWFPMYIPLAEPQQLQAGQKLDIQFWRCVSDRKVWYEWGTSSPNVSHVHNLNGRSCHIKK